MPSSRRRGTGTTASCASRSSRRPGASGARPRDAVPPRHRRPAARLRRRPLRGARRAKTFAQCTEEEVERYLHANVAAVAEVAALAAPRARPGQPSGDGTRDPRSRRCVGGSPTRSRCMAARWSTPSSPIRSGSWPLAREGIDGARGVLVGSRHTAESLWEALGDPAPAGADRAGAPRRRRGALRAREAGRSCGGAAGTGARSCASEPAEGVQGRRGQRLRPRRPISPRRRSSAWIRERDLLVAYVGKLIVSKGVDLLLASWPLVLERLPQGTPGRGRLRRLPPGAGGADRGPGRRRSGGGPPDRAGGTLARGGLGARTAPPAPAGLHRQPRRGATRALPRRRSRAAPSGSC